MVAEHIRAGRSALKWTQVQLSEAAGIDAATISRLENHAADRCLDALTDALKALVREQLDAGQLDREAAAVLCDLLVEACDESYKEFENVV